MILEDYTTNLLDLVRFRLSAFWLQVQDFLDVLFGKDMVTTTDTLIKTEIVLNRSLRSGRKTPFLLSSPSVPDRI